MLDFKKKFGRRLAELRKKQGLSQEEVAEKIDIAPRNLSKIETGVTFPSIENLEKIISVLNCKTSDLFEFEHLADSDDLRNAVIKMVKNIDNEKLTMLYKFLNSII